MSLSESPLRVRPTGDSAGLSWRRALREAFRDPEDLLAYLGLPADLAGPRDAGGFATLVPRGFADRMRKGDPNDPLLLQVLPRQPEVEGEDLPRDAVGDLPAAQAPGFIQKYSGRVLLTLAAHCAVNCRYCFRRHFPYGTVPASDAAWLPALDQIESDPEIREVILSGGDPLVLGDNRLGRFFDRLNRISHVETLRIHTRLPIVIPERVTNELVEHLAGLTTQTVVVLHANHAAEIDVAVERAISRLREAGAVLLNQSVLLRGVNDSVAVLSRLSRRLIGCGVVPYYLHRLDVVAGVQHFEVSEEEGERLIEGLRAELPGYAVPRFAREDAGAVSKTVLA